jgi:hypothetical protein
MNFPLLVDIPASASYNRIRPKLLPLSGIRSSRPLLVEFIEALQLL